MPTDKYEFLEWYKLDAIYRAYLIPTIEGVRPGANLAMFKLERKYPVYFLQQKKLLEFVLKKLGLAHRERDGDYYVARDPLLLDRLWSNKLKMSDFLGYPDCCATAFYVGCEKAMASDLECGPAVQFSRKRKPNDNLLFDYNFHVPCGVECQPSVRVGKAIKAALENNDPGAALALVEDNQQRLYEFHYYYPPK